MSKFYVFSVYERAFQKSQYNALVELQYNLQYAFDSLLYVVYYA